MNPFTAFLAGAGMAGDGGERGEADVNASCSMNFCFSEAGRFANKCPGSAVDAIRRRINYLMKEDWGAQTEWLHR